MVREPLDAPGANDKWRRRRKAVKEAFLHAWEAYESKAFGFDELHPLSGGHDVMGLGITLVDSLDTMLLLDLHDTPAYARAREWVATHFDTNIDRDLSVFETSIRVLGGLLSTYALSGDTVYLNQSRALGDKLVQAMETPTGLPASVINPRHGSAKRDYVNPYNGNKCRFGDPTTVAEVGSIQLELQYLSHATGDPKYAALGDKAMLKLMDMAVVPGIKKAPNPAPYRGVQEGKGEFGEGLDMRNKLFPVDVHPREGRFVSDRISLGSGGDSFYECLLKQHFLQPFSKRHMLRQFKQVIEAAMSRVRGEVDPTPGRPSSSKLKLFLGEGFFNGAKTPIKRMEHLACFTPGMLALASTAPDTELHERESLLLESEAIMDTCMSMYDTRSGLAAETYEVVMMTMIMI